MNWNLAPVADVNVPANPVIGTRAFGSDPHLVARQVAAWVRGLQGARVAACAKHWPGHGSTAQDSHLELPTLVGDVEAGLEPFRAAIDAGVKSIMTAHIRVHDLPATVDPALIQGRLRDDLGFDGVVMADALEMKAVADTVGVESTAVRALAAGVDALCVGHDLGEDAVDRIRAALVANVDEGRLREAAERIARLADWARPGPGVADHAGAAAGAGRALLVEGDVTLTNVPVIVELRPQANIAAGEAEHGLGDAPVVREGELVPPADVYVVRDAHRHPWMQRAADVPGAIVVETGLPVWRPILARGYVATYGGGRASLAAAGRGTGAVTSHLEQRAARPAGGARPADRTAADVCRGDRRALPPQRRPVRPDRLAGELVERCALRAVPARPGAPGPGRVRNALALHPLRTAPAARRRPRRRHLAVRRVA